MIKKGFTLIELLIVVAIIGILAGVGVPMYNGYVLNAKIKATTANHKNIVNFISANLTNCAAGSSAIALKSNNRQPSKDISLNCNNSTYAFAQNFVNHFNNTGFKDHFFGLVPVRYGNSWMQQGITAIGNKNNTITIITNIGREDGFNEFLRASIMKE